MNFWKTWKTCWSDRRDLVQNISLVLVAVIIISLFSAAMASVAPPSTGKESLGEHSVLIIDVMAYIIIVLVGALVAIVLWNVKDLKTSVRGNHEEIKRELKKKVSIQVHNAICNHKIEVDPE